MSICYAGLPEGLAYTLEFTEKQRETGSGEVSREKHLVRARNLLRPNRLPAADLTIIGTSAAKARLLRGAGSLVMPIRVHFLLDFADGVDSILGRASKGARRDFRQTLRKHEWQFGIERDAAWFDFFYDRIYSATMRARYGARARTEGRESAYECLFRQGILFYLSMDGRRIAGHLCHWDAKRGVLTSRLLGVLDGTEELYAAGALKVMYFLLIEWCGRNGVGQLDFQGTEAFLSKGTFQMKRRFGTRVALPPNHFGGKRLWLQVHRDTPAVRDFLVANPLLVEGADRALVANYFFDRTRSARIDYQGGAPGIARVHHIDLDDFLSGAQVSDAALCS